MTQAMPYEEPIVTITDAHDAGEAARLALPDPTTISHHEAAQAFLKFRATYEVASDTHIARLDDDALARRKRPIVNERYAALLWAAFHEELYADT